MTMTAPEALTSDVDSDASDGHYHVVRKADIARGYVEGVPVKAVCGRVFVPSRDPMTLPACPPCIRIRGQLSRNSGN